MGACCWGVRLKESGLFLSMPKRKEVAEALRMAEAVRRGSIERGDFNAVGFVQATEVAGLDGYATYKVRGKKVGADNEVEIATRVFQHGINDGCHGSNRDSLGFHPEL